MVSKKQKFTVIDYTLEQFMEEKKRAEKITETLEKMASVMHKFEDYVILIDFEIKKMKKHSANLEKRLQKLERKNGKR